MNDPVEIDPEGFARRIAEYEEWLKVRHFSSETFRLRGACLGAFVRWGAERGLTRPGEVTKPVLERYQRHLFHYRKKNGQPLSLSSQRNHLRSLRAFFKWLSQSNWILSNPASELYVPRPGYRLPKHVLSAAEAERVLAVPDVRTPTGLRDRAILETLYSTGIRRLELVRLQLYDLDPDHGTLGVRHGKGNRERLVPIGDRAIAWVEKYLHESRPRLFAGLDPGWLFVSARGEAIDPCTLSDLVSRYVKRSGVGKTGSAHLFRHTMATLMLEGGADIRYIQAILGHATLESTQVYTQVSIKKLKAIHDAVHPAGRKNKARPSQAPSTRSPEAGAATGRDPGAPSESRGEGGSPPGADGIASKTGDAATP